MRRLFLALIGGFVIAVLTTISGCTWWDDKEESTLESSVDVERITLTMGVGVNDNWPVSVELLRVKNTEQLSQLLRMETAQWFSEQGEVFKQTYLYPEVYYNMWEIVPGTTIGPELIEETDVEVAGVIFCYTRQKSLPKRFDIDGDAIVQIVNDGCKLSGGTILGPPGQQRGNDKNQEGSSDDSIWSYLWPW